MNFIQPINLYANLEDLRHASDFLITDIGWADRNQIGLTHRRGTANVWTDAVGSLYDRQLKIFTGSESDFTEMNTLPQALSDSLTQLRLHTGKTFGRIRLMRLEPRRGLSVHRDNETRYHYVIRTNPKSYICVNNGSATELQPIAQCYHIPDDGQWYHVDTREIHWVYNGGDTDRIHLVVCALD